MHAKALQSCPVLCVSDPLDCSPPGSSVHGILQARILEWAASSRGSSQPRDQTGSPALQADSLAESPGKPQNNHSSINNFIGLMRRLKNVFNAFRKLLDTIGVLLVSSSSIIIIY